MSRPLLQVTDLEKHYPQRRGFLATPQMVPAVDGVDFEIGAGETLGLVGESGCGKTTVGKAIVKLTTATSGRIVFDDRDITDLSQKAFRPLRRDMQMIFQDLDAALNPKMRVRDILAEAVRVHRRGMDAATVQQKVNELLERVNLKQGKLTSFPGELSGGEKRRVGIARVLAVEPRFIVADEPTSALDVSIQAQVVNLLQDLQTELGLTYLFISHDLPLVELISHKVAVMYRGRIVEMGTAQEIAARPRHPYTAMLWSSLKETVKDAGGNVSANGCPFAPRCPHYHSVVCADAPQLREVRSGHKVACHFPLA